MARRERPDHLAHAQAARPLGREAGLVHLGLQRRRAGSGAGGRRQHGRGHRGPDDLAPGAAGDDDGLALADLEPGAARGRLQPVEVVVQPIEQRVVVEPRDEPTVRPGDEPQRARDHPRRHLDGVVARGQPHRTGHRPRGRPPHHGLHVLGTGPGRKALDGQLDAGGRGPLLAHGAGGLVQPEPATVARLDGHGLDALVPDRALARLPVDPLRGAGQLGTQSPGLSGDGERHVVLGAEPRSQPAQEPHRPRGVDAPLDVDREPRGPRVQGERHAVGHQAHRCLHTGSHGAAHGVDGLGPAHPAHLDAPDAGTARQVGRQQHQGGHPGCQHENGPGERRDPTPGRPACRRRQQRPLPGRQRGRGGLSGRRVDPRHRPGGRDVVVGPGVGQGALRGQRDRRVAVLRAASDRRGAGRWTVGVGSSGRVSRHGRSARPVGPREPCRPAGRAQLSRAGA